MDGVRKFLSVVQILDKVLRKAWGIVLYNLLGEVRVDGVDILAELGARCCVDFLNTLEASTFDKGLLGLVVLGKNFGKLGGDVSEDVVRSEDEEGFKRGKMGAHLNNIFQGLLRFVLQVSGSLSFLHHVHS